MESPRKHKPSDAVKEEVESEDGNDLLVKHSILRKKLVKRRKIEVSGSIVQLQQLIEAFDMENKMPDIRSVEDSTGKDTLDVLTSCAANGHKVTGSESASSRLLKICKTIGWKEPSYDFEQGPPHIILFKCKVTVHLDGLVNTIVECFSNPKPTMEDAQEHAAQGALWFLQSSGYVK